MAQTTRSGVTERLDATVRGIVQGVGFRWFVVRQAGRLGLTGWVSNEPDGAVRVVAEGTTAALDEFLVRLRTGPAGATVDRVDTQRLSAIGDMASFTIRAGGHRGD